MKNAPEAGFRTYRCDLPHWRAADEVQHVVWRLSRWQCPLTHDERQLIVNALRPRASPAATRASPAATRASPAATSRTPAATKRCPPF